MKLVIVARNKHSLAKTTDLRALAEDSGLELDALNGAPKIGSSGEGLLPNRTGA
jgi:inosine/xanthosine triphosphate pyrophosphatase family protein